MTVPDADRVDAPVRRSLLLVGAVLLLAALLLRLLAGGRALPLPVTAGFPGGPGASGGGVRFVLARVDLVAAALVPVVLGGVARLLGAVGPVHPRLRSAADRGALGPGWVPAVLTGPIVVFLVAQLNGVRDAGALVLVYAASSGAVLLCALQERVAVWGGPRELALWFAAALGIVPWGVIALHQVGALVVGSTPSAAVRGTTLVVLVASAVAFLAVWRAQRAGRASAVVAAQALGALPALLLAALVVLAVR